MKKELIPILKGAAVAVALAAIGVPQFTPEWWTAMVALNVAVNG